MSQNQIIEELKHIPEQKMSKLYDLIHYFRLGLESEGKLKAADNDEEDMVGRMLDHPVCIKDSSPLGREEIHAG